MFILSDPGGICNPGIHINSNKFYLQMTAQENAHHNTQIKMFRSTHTTARQRSEVPPTHTHTCTHIPKPNHSCSINHSLGHMLAWLPLSQTHTHSLPTHSMVIHPLIFHSRCQAHFHNKHTVKWYMDFLSE